MKYICKYYSGGGTEYNGGIWEKTETPKTIKFEQIEKSFFNPNCTKFTINKFYPSKIERKDGNYNAFRDFGDYIGWVNNGHCLRDWKNNTYTAYPNQAGIPYYFETI